MSGVGFSNARPGQEGYQTAYDNKGKYGSNLGRPYINPDVPMYVPSDGQNCVRIVDPIELIQLGVYFFNVHMHREVGYKNDYFLCDKEMGKGPCPQCELVTPDLWDTDKEMAKNLSSDMRRLIWVLDLQKPQEASILKLWSAPRTLSDEILTQSRRPDLNVYLDIAHPNDGVPVFFNRSGKGKFTKYTGVQLGQEAYPIGEDVAFQRFEFNDILMWHTYDEFKTAMNLGAPDGAPVAGGGAGYDAASNVPAATMGAAEAAAANPIVENPPAGSSAGQPGEIDYSDRTTIDPNNGECFRTNYDEYNECAGCIDNVKCAEPWPVFPEAAKTAKPSKAAKPGKPGKPTPPVAGAGAGPARVTAPATPANPATPATPTMNPATNPTVAGGGNKIKDAQARLQKEIAQRKGTA